MTEPETWDARLVGVVDGCTNPESAEMLPDGETFVFGNCTMLIGNKAHRDGKSLVYLKDQAYISKARWGADGTVEVVERHLIDGLTSTLGIDILRTGTERFPAGTAFIATGGKPITTSLEAPLVTDEKAVRQQALGFDPQTGEVRGSIPLWPGSAVARRYHHLEMPNGLAIDDAGNLYVTDNPNTNPLEPMPSPVPSRVYRIDHSALDAMAAGDTDAVDAVEAVEWVGWFNGVTVSPLDQSVWVVSCSRHDPVNGAVYRLTREDFRNERLPEPVYRDLVILDGVGVTRRGTVLVSNPMSGEVHLFTNTGKHHVLRAGGEKLPARLPADMNVVYPKALGGEPGLLVTDISVGRAPGEGLIALVDITGL